MILAVDKLARYEQKVGYARLDSVIDTLGDRGLMSLIVDKLSQGVAPSDIAADLGVPFMILWEWLEADPKRQSLYDEGWRMYATTLHAETVRIADMATPEDVGVAKLRVETRFKAASNYDRKRFGSRVEVAVSQTISVLDALAEARGRVLDGIAERLPEADRVSVEASASAAAPITAEVRAQQPVTITATPITAEEI